MTTPTDQFANLSISPSMAPSSEEVRRRANILQDVLSSFEPDVLPSEFQISVIAEIDRPHAARLEESQWTNPSDLQETLLRRGSYDDDCFEVLCASQRPDYRARAFYEKLSRRFHAVFTEYDDAIDGPDPIESVERMASLLRALDDGVRKEPEHCSDLSDDIIRGREAGTLDVMLTALENVCERDQPKRRLSRSSAGSGELARNLFDALIGSKSAQDHEAFMLDNIFRLSSPPLRSLLPRLQAVRATLAKTSAPREYLDRFDNIIAKAEASPKLRPEPRPGSKRTQPPSGDSAQRGKRRGGRAG